MSNVKKYIIGGILIAALLISKRMSAANWIAKKEGIKLNAYQDTAGIWTIGYGTIRHHDLGRPIRQGDKITRAKAVEWLEKDTAAAAAAVSRLVKVPLTENQRIALTSLVYNIGSGAFSRSTMLRMINEKQPANKVAPQFLRWVIAGGKVSRGLVNRRTAEMELFLS